MSDYNFVTRWQFEAPIAQVWDEIYHTSRWPSWWKAVLSVEELKPGDKQGVGAIKRYTWRGVLPYTLTFDMKVTRVEAPELLEGSAFGELEGTGRWELSEKEGITHVQYLWQVRATKAWMQWLSPIARPIFGWNHDRVMQWGEQGLRARLTG